MNLKQLLRLCFILFALSPCIVKGSLLSGPDAEYVKPMNPTKAPSATQVCEYISGEEQHTASTHTENEEGELKNTGTSLMLPISVSSVSFSENDFHRDLSQFPPKYILYKRLKFGMI